MDPIASPDQVRREQEEDGGLSKVRKLADAGAPPKQQGSGHVQFVWKRGLLYRIYVDQRGAEFQQLVVPEKLRGHVLRVGHDIPMAGHLASQKTQDCIWLHFYWPGMCGDIRRYCQSCDMCQRTFPKGRTKKVPLGTMPLSVVPFQRVAVDIIGPVLPASERGHRFILVVVDFATRYPEAIALKRIDTATVAEALWGIWTRVGVPERVLSDNGTQFTSEMMKETLQLLSVHQDHTTPYHAQCNGAVERFNGTLKTMLKRMCIDHPREWDRYLPAVLFAYREVPHASSGFSPFELLYGRTVRGPLQVLKQLWTKEEMCGEKRTIAEYVVDLRNRIATSCGLAQKNLDTEALRQRVIKDRSAEDRRFRVGDKVLLLLPTKENKLELAWRGPFTVIECISNLDYRLQVGRKTKLYHANLLRRYHDRRTQNEEAGIRVVVMDMEEGKGFPPITAIPLIPLEAEESPKDVVICPELSPGQRAEIMQLCTTEAASTLTDLPGRTDLDQCELVLSQAEPVRIRQYPLPHAKMEVVQQEVESMLRLGVIEAAASPYSAPVVLVAKKDGRVRFCIDYRQLNRILVFDAEPLPDIDHLFSKLVRSRYLTKIDLSRGYWQIPMREEDKAKTAFTTPQGQFQWRVMPFGLKTAGAVFSRVMRKLLLPLQRNEVDNFMDDILIHTETWEGHMEALRVVFGRLKEANLTARPKKCSLAFAELSYLGHHVGRGQMRPEMDKVRRIRDAKFPTSKKLVRSFLGMAGYYRRFIPDYAAMTAPFTDALRKGQPEHIQGTPQLEEAFAKVKAVLSSEPVLAIPDVKQPFVLQTDASDEGVGAILLQKQDDVLKPVFFASRKLKPAEKNYATVEKECLAIVWAVGKFEPYLFGHHFELHTDHSPLQYLNSAKPVSNRVTRWALLLQPYSFTVRSIPGKDNAGADFLSRSSVE
jgi:hypothetical protein